VDGHEFPPGLFSSFGKEDAMSCSFCSLCGKCGRRLEDMLSVRCPECGYVNKEEAANCTNCGASLPEHRVELPVDVPPPGVSQQGR
jgi:predicted RNA-binding Zn-ribbon protein involved in translation (DUF1610 family)